METPPAVQSEMEQTLQTLSENAVGAALIPFLLLQDCAGAGELYLSI